MGQYFNWVNVSRQEWLDGSHWGYSPTLHGRSFTPCDENDALLALLATRWRGDVVVFLGDYADFRRIDHPGCRRIHTILDEVRGFLPDFAFDGRDVAGEPEAMAVQRYRYVVNPARREYIDYESTPVINVFEDVDQRYDPLPELLCSMIGLSNDPAAVLGRWLGDTVLPTTDEPEEGYRLIAKGVKGTLLMSYHFGTHPIVRKRPVPSLRERGFSRGSLVQIQTLDTTM